MARRPAVTLRVETSWASPRQIDAMLVKMLREQGVEVVDVELSADGPSDGAEMDDCNGGAS